MTRSQSEQPPLRLSREPARWPQRGRTHLATDHRRTRRAVLADRATIRSRAQVRALIAPARQEIVDVLESAGPCPVATIAALLGRPADALYHHLGRLKRAGLVVERARRKQGRHVFSLYDLARRPLRISHKSPVRPSDLAAVFAAAHRLAWRDFRRALLARSGVASGPRRTLWGARVTGWAAPPELAKINRLLTELLATLRQSRPAAGATPISLSFVLSPSRQPASHPNPSKDVRARRAARTAHRKTNGGTSP